MKSGLRFGDDQVIPQSVHFVAGSGLTPLSVLLWWIVLLALRLPRGSGDGQVSSISPLTTSFDMASSILVLAGTSDTKQCTFEADRVTWQLRRHQSSSRKLRMTVFCLMMKHE